MCRTSIFGKWQLASDFLIDGPLPPSLHLICAPPRLLSVRRFVVLLHGSTSWDIFRGTSMSTATTQPRMHITRTLSLMPQLLRSSGSARGSHLRALLSFSRTTPAIIGRRRRKLELRRLGRGAFLRLVWAKMKAMGMAPSSKEG